MNEEKTQGLSGETGNCKIGDYMTPSAFITMGTNGLWVGKFETGNKSITNESNSVLNKNDSTKVQIKPNVYSWRGIQVANAYLTSYNYKREYDSHMMKNTEWGVVAYLQHSKYGSALRVRINNNAAYITGYAAIREGVDIQKTSLKEDGTYTKNYKNPLSQVASTTGNYSGIYDMNGGATEYVMGVMLNKSNTRPLSGKNNIYNSGFNGVYAEGGSLTTGVAFPETKYYDCYVYNDSNNMYIRGIMGDATKELGGFGKNNISSWYENKVLLTISSSPWFVRGSRSSSDLDVGIFTSNAFWGNNYSLNTFRIVLAIK